MSKKEKPTVGQIIYSLNVGNAARNRERVLTECRVISVGWKHFTLSPVGQDRRTHKHYISDWREVSDYMANSELYETREEYASKRERDDLISEVREFFGPYGRVEISLDQIRRISQIIKEEQP